MIPFASALLASTVATGPGGTTTFTLDFTTGTVPAGVTASGGANGKAVATSGKLAAASAGRLDYGALFWTPANLATPPVAWWDAADEATITLASGSFTAGGPVSAWVNKGSAGGSATQATAGNRPSFSRSGLNGTRAALVFTAASNTALGFAAGVLPTGAVPSGVVAVGSILAPSGVRHIIGWGAQATNQVRQVAANGANVFAGLWDNDISTTVGLTVPKVTAWTADPADGQRLFVDGTAAGTALASAMATASGGGRLGNGPLGGTAFPWNGPISEVIVLGYLPTTDERQTIEGYLASRWSTQAGLPGAHPFKAFPPITGAVCKGILVEAAATNIARQSETFDNASWQKTNSTVTVDALAAPDGTTTADLITEGAAGGSVGQNFTNVTTAAFTCSVFVKAGNHQWLRLAIQNGGGTQIAAAWFDLAGKAAGTRSVLAGTPTQGNSGIEDYGNGWVRCWFTATIPVGTTNTFAVLSAAANGSTTLVPNATHYLWGAQIEQAVALSSYIGPTAASAVTRSADAVAFTIPAGTTRLAVQFDDDSSQSLTVAPGAYTLPTALNRPRVKVITGST